MEECQCSSLKRLRSHNPKCMPHQQIHATYEDMQMLLMLCAVTATCWPAYPQAINKDPSDIKWRLRCHGRSYANQMLSPIKTNISRWKCWTVSIVQRASVGTCWGWAGIIQIQRMGSKATLPKVFFKANIALHNCHILQNVQCAF